MELYLRFAEVGITNKIGLIVITYTEALYISDSFLRRGSFNGKINR
jgi:hypothetical protein